MLLSSPDGGEVRLTELPGGLRVITEQVPGVRSVAFGVWVGIGTRDEVDGQFGSAHYLEHLLFKGTTRRSAMDISAAIDAVGGELNAFTTKEYTCYYARVLDVDLDLAIDVVCDVVCDALIRPDDVESERGVILEEIAMHDDDPADVVHEEFASAMFTGSPLAVPVLGTVETIESISRDAIDAFYRGRYTPEHMVVAAAGHLEHDAVVTAVARAFQGRLVPGASPAPPRAKVLGQAVGPGATAGPLTVAQAHGHGTRVLDRPTEQAHLVLGMPGIPRIDDRRYALAVLTTALGGGMSSRLFQEIREKRGLAYSVYAYSQGFADDGIFGVYVGCLPGKVPTVLEVCRAELSRLVADGLTEEELARGRGQVKGSTVLGQEDTGARMTRIARSLLHGDPLLAMSDVLARIDAVTAADVRSLAADVLARPELLAVIGPFPDDSSFAA